MAEQQATAPEAASVETGASPLAETAKWTRFLPETFGIREQVQNSPFRWCVRESAMWGIATGTAMGLHRLRMKSTPFFAINVAFGTILLVTSPSYYFCYRRREHKEKVIELMMRANDFKHEEDMPEPVPLGKDHPFLEEVKEGSEEEAGLQKEFVARLKERKEWQEPHPTEDAEKVFKEVKRK